MTSRTRRACAALEWEGPLPGLLRNCRRVTRFLGMGVLVGLPLLALHAAGETPSLQGVLVISNSGVSYASLKNPQSSSAEWVSAGSYFGAHRVAEIHPDRVVLVTPEGASVVVLLNDAENRSDSGAGDTASAKDPEFGTPAWINSRRNPMVFTPISIPQELSRRWADLPPEERMEIVKWYQAHGWNLEVETYGGYFGANFRNIYAEERSAIVQAKIGRFRAALTEAQRETFDSLRRDSIAGMASAPATGDTQQAQLIRRWEDFRSGLTEPQRRSLRTMSDFTAPDEL